MSIGINDKFLSDVKMSDELYYESLTDELESLIEAELSKPEEEINEAFIDDCCVAIEYLCSVRTGEAIKSYETIVDIESMIKSYHRRAKTIYISSAACAAVAILCAGLFSLRFADVNKQSNLRPYESPVDLSERTETNGSNNNIEESETIEYSQTTENITTLEPVSTTEQIATDVITPPGITRPIPTIYRLDVFARPGTSLTFKDESLIDLSGITVVVSYSDNSTEIIPIEECQVDIGTADENGKVKVTVTYKYVCADVYVTVDPTVE